jgi:hypothetical protein
MRHRNNPDYVILNEVIELAQKACFCRFAALTVPRAILLDLGSSVFEELNPR